MVVVLAALALATDPFATCRQELVATTDRYEAWRCFYMAVRKGAPPGGAEAALVAGAQDDPWAAVVLGHLYSDRGDDRAAVTYRAAIERFPGDGAGRAQAGFGLANFLWHRGTDPAAVEATLLAAEVDAASSGSEIVLATARAQLARHLLRTATDYDRAYTLAREAEAQAFPAGPYQLRLLVLHVLAGVCRDTARIEEEQAYRQRMTDLAVTEGDAYVEATSRINVAQHWLVYPEDVPPGSARAEAERALQAAIRAGNAYSEAGAHCVLARAVGVADPGAAAHWRACIDGYALVGAPESAILGRAGLALATVGHDPLAAVALADAAVAEAERSAAGESEIEARIVAGVVRAMAGRPEADAFLVRAVERLEATRERQTTEEERAGVGARWRLAYDVLSASRRSGGDVAGAFGAMERLRGRQLLAWLEAGSLPPPGWTPAGDDDDRGVLARVQAALGPGEVLVSWQLPPEQRVVPFPTPPWALVVRAGKAEVVELPVLSRPSRRLDAYLGLVAARGAEMAAPGPLEPWLAAIRQSLGPEDHRVVGVADGAMHRLPIQLGRPITVVPSARVWLNLRARQLAPAAAGAVAVAGRDMPRAGREVAALVARLGGTVVQPATLKGLLAAGIANFRLLHIAAHAQADGSRPARGSIALPGGDGDQVHDREVMGLGLAGQVVVLSACSTASGRVVSGEGVIGLARAFLQGGARVVVGSRWPVRDSEAEAWVDLFTGELAAGRAVDEAVHRASATLRSRGAPVAAWAAFTVVGDGGWTPFPGGTGSAFPFGWLAGAAALAALGTGAIRVWRRF